MDDEVIQSILHDRKIAYAVTDRDLRVLEAKGSIQALRGALESIVGRSLVELAPELIGIEAVLGDIVDGVVPRFELAWVNRETVAGDKVYLSMVILPHYDREARITGLVHLMQDVTEMGMIDQQLAQSRNELQLLQDRLRQRNLELAAANAELQRVDEIKSTFVSVAAHELRSPLTSISGYVEMLLDADFGPLTESQRERLSIVQGSARRLLTTTEALLDLTRIEAGRVQLMLQPTDLSTLVERVIAEFEPQLKAKAQRLTVRAITDLPPALCDAARVVQIVSNLLSNASRYSPPGGSITVSLTPANEDGFLQVSVEDMGAGVRPEDRDMVFRRFFRSEGARRSEADGAGLGLYIARSLVELHGGQIWFDSEVGEGSTFHVTFPVADTRV
ncbi:MAG: PAS domain-containing protein [Chloroflexi bacterium]|nr:PAS domain-containing protein [Chloroflexota bacterium]